MAAKRAAIKADAVDDKTLDKLSAAQFVEALQKRQASSLLRYWPEKKKYELELEPGALGNLRFRDFLDIVERIKGEKKKAEYEFDEWWRWRINPDPTPWRGDPNPQPNLIAHRIDELATQLERLSAKVEQLAGQ